MPEDKRPDTKQGDVRMVEVNSADAVRLIANIPPAVSGLEALSSAGFESGGALVGGAIASRFAGKAAEGAAKKTVAGFAGRALGVAASVGISAYQAAGDIKYGQNKDAYGTIGGGIGALAGGVGAAAALPLLVSNPVGWAVLLVGAVGAGIGYLAGDSAGGVVADVVGAKNQYKGVVTSEQLQEDLKIDLAKQGITNLSAEQIADAAKLRASVLQNEGFAVVEDGKILEKIEFPPSVKLSDIRKNSGVENPNEAQMQTLVSAYQDKGYVVKSDDGEKLPQYVALVKVSESQGRGEALNAFGQNLTSLKENEGMSGGVMLSERYAAYETVLSRQADRLVDNGAILGLKSQDGRLLTAGEAKDYITDALKKANSVDKEKTLAPVIEKIQNLESQVAAGKAPKAQKEIEAGLESGLALASPLAALLKDKDVQEIAGGVKLAVGDSAAGRVIEGRFGRQQSAIGLAG